MTPAGLSDQPGDELVFGEVKGGRLLEAVARLVARRQRLENSLAVETGDNAMRCFFHGCSHVQINGERNEESLATPLRRSALGQGCLAQP